MRTAERSRSVALLEASRVEFKIPSSKQLTQTLDNRRDNWIALFGG
jgi:hypothetical protein